MDDFGFADVAVVAFGFADNAVDFGNAGKARPAVAVVDDVAGNGAGKVGFTGAGIAQQGEIAAAVAGGKFACVGFDALDNVALGLALLPVLRVDAVAGNAFVEKALGDAGCADAFFDLAALQFAPLGFLLGLTLCFGGLLLLAGALRAAECEVFEYLLLVGAVLRAGFVADADRVHQIAQCAGFAVFEYVADAVHCGFLRV